MSDTFLLSMDECVRVNEQLQKGLANSRASDLLDILSALQASEAKGRLKNIAHSKLGATVNKLTKHGDDKVKAAAVALKKAWQALSQQAAAPKPVTSEAEAKPAEAPKPEPVDVKPTPPAAASDSDNAVGVKPEASASAMGIKSDAGDGGGASSSAAASVEPVPLTTNSSMSVSAPKRNTAKTGENTRDMVREKLQEAFEVGQETNAAYLREQYVDTALMAEEAESSMNATFGGTSKEYKARFRSLMFNLKDKKNPEFIRMVMTGQLHVNDLATMEVREMASDEMKKQRATAAEHAKMSLMDERTYKQYAGKETQDGILKCPRCKSMKTEYIEVQTRSADEPTTKKCTCNACDYRWKFC